jgi:hypothetical protein
VIANIYCVKRHSLEQWQKVGGWYRRQTGPVHEITIHDEKYVLFGSLFHEVFVKRYDIPIIHIPIFVLPFFPDN